MLGNLTLYEIKPLKGPDRLLRLHVKIDGALEVNDSINMLADVAHSLIFKYHRLNINFPVADLLNALPTNRDYHNFKYGELMNGVLGIEILFMRKSASLFKIRYYPPELEFERNFGEVDRYVSLNKIDMGDYKFHYTLGNFREGFNVDPFNIKIDYSK